MYRLQRILVCLDLTEMDEFVVKYAGLLAQTMQSREVYFFHADDDQDIPKSVLQKYPELDSRDIDPHRQMEKVVSQHIPNYKDYDFKFIVRKGRASRAILRWSEIEHMDLILMGNKSELKGKGVNPRKIANISHCSVLFVPENVSPSLNKLFIPIDFSLRSKTAIDQALAIREHNNAEIILQHVFFVPQGYHYTGKTAEEFAIIMRENAEKDYARFLKRNGYDPSMFQDVYTFDDDDAPADKIYLEAMNFNADLIILSSRGRTKAASLLLGSSALELLKFHQKIPYMIIKDKKENMDFFQALMKI